MTALKVLKISVLLIVAIGAMRLASWVLGWLFQHVIRISSRTSAVAANAACFVIYVAWRYEDSRNVGGMDWSEILFGAAVWGVCLFFDLMRAKRRATSASSTA